MNCTQPKCKQFDKTKRFFLSVQMAAVYIRGKRDIFLYEYMQYVCGDSLTPFLLYQSSEHLSWKRLEAGERN